MNSSTDFDIVIAGAGMVGASLAYALASNGLTVAIIEPTPPSARQQVGFDERSITLSYSSSRIYASLGLWQRIAEHATPIRTIQITEAGRFGTARLDARDEGVDALGYVVNARAFNNVLNAAALPNVRMVSPGRVVSLRVADDARDAATVTVAIGDTEHAFSSQLIVGADGAESTVRQLLGVEASVRDYGQVAIVTNIDVAAPEDHGAFERFTPHGPIALLPNGGSRYGVVWMLASRIGRDIAALDDAAFTARLQSEFGARLGTLSRVGRRYSYPLKLTRSPQQLHTRAVLVGNAANALHPIGAQGFNLGLRDVAMLAELLVDARRAKMDLGADELLRRYQQSRVDDQRRTVLFTDVLARVFDAPWFAPLRPLGLIATQLVPPLKRQITRGALGLSGRLTRLARGLPL